MSPARSNFSLEKQQVPSVRRGTKEESGLEAGTINLTDYHALQIAEIRTQCWFAGEYDVIPSVRAIYISVPNQGCHSDVSEIDCYGLPSVFTLSILDWRRL